MIRKDIVLFKKSIPNYVQLVVASKYLTIGDMQQLLDHGINDFGESRVDSFLIKYQYFSNQKITWHFIGHLQRNKAKFVINKIDFLHSLDSLELAQIIQKLRETPLPVFIEVSINREKNKNGVLPENLCDFIRQIMLLTKIKLVGLMMMGKDDSSDEELHHQFANLRILKERIEKELDITIPYLSMGMSHDYKVAISEGATHIRLGRIISQ